MGKIVPYDVKEIPFEKLTPRQQKFIDLYVMTGNASQSAKEAGYKSTDSGVQLLKRFGNYIDIRKKEIASDRIADVQEIMEILTRIARGEEKDAFGLDTNNQDKLRALELLGKANQLYVDKVKTDLTTDITVNLINDDEEE